MAPTFQAASTAQASTGATVSVAWPTHLTNDIGILIIETSGNSATLTPPAGWAAIPSTPVTDVATIAGSKLHVWWKRATSSAEPAVATGAATDHILANLYTFRGCITTGNPWDVSTTGVKTTASTTATVPSLTTTLADTLVVMIVGRPNDNASVVHFGVPVNANLTTLTEHAEEGTVSGNGGGFVISSGIASVAGSTGTSTLTKIASTTDTYVTFALRSPFQLDVTNGSVNYFAQTILLQKTFRLDNTVSNFTFNGITAGLQLQLALINTVGTFSVTGNNALLQNSLQLVQQTGAYTLSGVSTNLQANLVLNQGVGSYTVTGIVTGLTYQQATVPPLVINTGAFTFTGNASDLIYQRLLTTQVNAFATSGTQLGLIRSLALNSILGTFSVSGTNLGLGLGLCLNISVGGFTSSGNNIGINNLFKLDTSTGQLTLAGQDLSFESFKVLNIQTQELVIDAKGKEFRYFKPSVIAKATPTRRNQWVYGRFTHMGRRFL